MFKSWSIVNESSEFIASPVTSKSNIFPESQSPSTFVAVPVLARLIIPLFAINSPSQLNILPSAGSPRRDVL